ncbi:MAG: hypothetical protein AAF550_09965 [Myxococcota bacterium]
MSAHASQVVGGLPAGLVQLQELHGAQGIALEIQTELFPLDAIFGASFTFIDRAFVFLDRPKETSVRVHLTLKNAASAPELNALRSLVGEFANELMACAFRLRITEENRATLESITMQAIAGAMGPPTLDELEDFDFSEEPFEDPLGIAMSWEEKYAKKSKEEPS